MRSSLQKQVMRYKLELNFCKLLLIIDLLREDLVQSSEHRSWKKKTVTYDFDCCILTTLLIIVITISRYSGLSLKREMAILLTTIDNESRHFPRTIVYGMIKLLYKS